MKRHRFFLDTFFREATVLSSPDLVHQIARVLKLKTGEEISSGTALGMNMCLRWKK